LKILSNYHFPRNEPPFAANLMVDTRCESKGILKYSLLLVWIALHNASLPYHWPSPKFYDLGLGKLRPALEKALRESAEMRDAVPKKAAKKWLNRRGKHCIAVRLDRLAGYPDSTEGRAPKLSNR
jgi:hypothetical protein